MAHAQTEGQKGDKSNYGQSAVILPDPDGGGGQTASDVIAVYDAELNLTSTTDELGRVTTYAYDALNRLTSVTLPDPDGEGELAAPVTTYQYDKASNLRYVIDPLGNTTEYQYDHLNRLVQIVEADPDGGGGLTPMTTCTV